MTETQHTVTLAEWITLRCVIAVAPDIDPVEVLEGLRALTDNATLVADLHGVALDQPIGPERANTILREAAGLIQAGRAIA